MGDAAERFSVGAKLGAGGMGVVYRARDHERGIDVALKTLRNASGRDLYRFKREFRALADIVHPNLATLHELYTVGDEWFFTMELVEGTTFLDWVRPHGGAGEQDRGSSAPPSTDPDAPTITSSLPAPVDRRERIVEARLDAARLEDALRQLCDGVHALHLVGKLHRDLKPSNVLVDDKGRVVLLDFGLVQALADGPVDLTHERAVVGTPAYMSPEQAADQPLTEASDWYAVGVMLYEALTGRRPFEGATHDVLARKQREDPPPPGALAPVPPALDALCARLLARDPLARPTGEEILRALGVAPSPATLALAAAHAAAPFVGREPELGALRDALARSRRGCVVTLVRGRSGMGKSALLRRFLDEVACDPDAVVLEGRCFERETVPYKALDPLIDALATHLARIPAPALATLLPPGIAALARLFPVLRRVPEIADPVHRIFQPPDPIELRRRGFDALRALLRALAVEHPVVLAIDDVQWGDADSATFLGDLVHHPEPPAILLVSSHRLEDEAASPVARELRAGGPGSVAEIREVTVGALGDADARALIEQVAGGGGARADAILRESEGSPLFLSELARSAGDGVRRLDDVVIARVEALPLEAQALLAVCAVAARPLRVSIALAAAGVAGDGAPLARLRAERLLRLRGGVDTAELEPYHDRVREAVVAAMPAAEVRAIHLALARTLEADPRADREALVEHWLAGGERARAAEAAIAAAAAAEEALAFHRAAALYELALAQGDWPPARRRAYLVRKGDALANAGRLDDAAAAFAEAAVGADALEGRLLKRRELEQVLRRGHLDRGFEESRALLASVGFRLPRTVRGAMLSIATQRLLVRLGGLDFRERAEADVPPAELERLDIAWSLSTGLSFVQPIIGKALQMSYLRRALATGEPRRIAQAMTLELGYRSIPGSPVRDETERLVARSVALAARLGDPYLVGIVGAASGLPSFLTGHFREAAERFGAAERYLRDRCADVRWELDLCELFRIASLWYLGETREVARLAPIYLREATERGDVYAERGHRTWRSNLAWLVVDDPATARANAIAGAVPEGGATSFQLHHYYELLAHGQIDLYIGDGAGAAERVERTWADLERSMLRRIQTVRIESDYLRARAALATPPTRARLRLAERCARALERTGAAWAGALAIATRAQIAARRGASDEAAARLGEAADAFAAVDLRLFEAAARRCRARVADDDATRGAADAATAFMTEQAIADPDAITRMLLPGVA